MENGPLVSVLMTAFNREQFIAEAIESVLASSYTSFELIISDDCSTDETVYIAKTYEQKDNRIKVFVNEENLGQFPNRNKASTYAQGEYIFWVDSDDTIFPDSINDLVLAMNKFPEASFGMAAPSYKEVSLIQSKDAIRHHFFEKPLLYQGPGSTIIRRDFFNKIGKYPINYGIPGDIYFNLKACCHSPLVLLPFDFMEYRRHEGQEFNNLYDYLYNNYKYLNDAITKLPLGLEKKEINWLHKKAKRRFTMNIIKYYFSTFNLKKTIFAIKAARFGLGDALVGIFH